MSGRVIEPPVSPENICLFVAYLHYSERAPKTITTYISAISYIHKILNFKDPSNSFLVSKLITGAYRLRHIFDIRLPITLHISNKPIDAQPHSTFNIFEATLFKAVFIFAFYTFARIGEITTKRPIQSHVIQFSDIAFGSTDKNSTANSLSKSLSTS